MNRLKAIYRSWAIPCAGQQVYAPRHRAAWLEKLREAGVRRRAEQTYQQLDFLMGIRKETRKELLADSNRSHGWRASGVVYFLLCQGESDTTRKKQADTQPRMLYIRLKRQSD
jgi:hypothetical protein